jgi:hypothetical protein
MSRFILSPCFNENGKTMTCSTTYSQQLNQEVPLDHLFLDRTPNIEPLISCWEVDKFKNCGNKSFRTSKILMLLYQQFSN